MDIEEHATETIAEAAEGGPHHAHPRAKPIALMIAILAALLAISEMGAKSAQNSYTALNLQATDTWNFYQAKTIRSTVLEVAIGQLELLPEDGMSPERRAAVDKRRADLRATRQRYETDPSTGEGRKELQGKAQAIEANRDVQLAGYHAFELAVAAVQLAVVLASAALLTGAMWLVLASGGLAVLGVGLDMIGWVDPEMIHHFM
jgi:hypothetical protein